MYDTITRPHVSNSVPFERHHSLNVDSLAEPYSDTASLAPHTVRDYEDHSHLVKSCQSTIPGRPDLTLDGHEVRSFLLRELGTPKFDMLYPRLWLAARKSGDNIDSLHRQQVKGRKIIVTEDPQMHLAWTEQSVHIKPIPECLLNYDFWERYLNSDMPHGRESNQQADGGLGHDMSIDRTSARRIAQGFLRSYALLVQHRSDLFLAKDYRLVPEDVTWSLWCMYIKNFRQMQGHEVSERYHYGQIRLSRLNWLTRMSQIGIGQSRWWYEKPYWSTGPYIQNAALVLAFVFAGLSLILSAMQVVLAAPDAFPTDSLFSGTSTSGRIFWGFGIAVILAGSAALVLLVLLPTIYVSTQVVWGVLHRHGNQMEQS